MLSQITSTLELVARFFLVQHTKTGKIYRKEKLISNEHKIDKLAVNTPNGQVTYQHLPMQDPTKFTQIVIFGLKI
jgi:hypothetical protein